MSGETDTTIGTGGATPPVLRGRITDGSGTPIADAFVAFGGNSPPHTDLGQMTSAEGLFFYPSLQPGTYTLMINSPAGQKAQLDVEVDPSTPKDLSIILLTAPSTSDDG